MNINVSNIANAVKKALGLDHHEELMTFDTEVYEFSIYYEDEHGNAHQRIRAMTWDKMYEHGQFLASRGFTNVSIMEIEA